MGKPEQVFKAGAVRASVFVNTIERNGQTVPIRKVVIEVRYRYKTGQWQGTNSLSLNEVPKAITALQQAYEHMLNAGSQVSMEAPHDEQPVSAAPSTYSRGDPAWPQASSSRGSAQ